MRNALWMVALQALLAFHPDGPPAASKPNENPSYPELLRTIPLDNVRGPVDRTGIAGRIDHMRYDPETKRLFIACVANETVEVVDLEKGLRVGSIAGLHEPQGIAVSAGWVFVTSGEDGRLHRFNTRTLAEEKSVAVGDDADNVRIASDGKVWVSHGGTGPGGISCFDPDSMTLEKKFTLPRMPEGFQVQPAGHSLFANMPAGKRSKEEGTVVGLKMADGASLWERKLIGHAGNFPMTLDPANGRIFLVTRSPARLLSLSTVDGSILGESDCPPESDDLLYDPTSGLVAVIGGGSPPTANDPGGVGAALDLFQIDGAGKPKLAGSSPLPPQTRTGTLAIDRRAIYVAVPMARDRPAEIREFRLPKSSR